MEKLATEFDKASELYKKDYPFSELWEEPSEIVHLYLERVRRNSD